MGLGTPPAPGSPPRTLEEAWPAGAIRLSARSLVTPEKRPDRVISQPAAQPCSAGTGSEPGFFIWGHPSRPPQQGPMQTSGCERPRMGRAPCPRPALRPQLGAVDMRQRPCPFDLHHHSASVSPPTHRETIPAAQVGAQWPVTAAGHPGRPCCRRGTEGVSRACLSASVVRGEAGVQSAPSGLLAPLAGMSTRSCWSRGAGPTQVGTVLAVPQGSGQERAQSHC